MTTTQRLKKELSRANSELVTKNDYMIHGAKDEIERLRNDLQLAYLVIRKKNQLISELAKELGAYHRNYNLFSSKIDDLLKGAGGGR